MRFYTRQNDTNNFRCSNPLACLIICPKTHGRSIRPPARDYFYHHPPSEMSPCRWPIGLAIILKLKKGCLSRTRLFFFFFPGMRLSGRAAGSRDVAAAGRRLFLLILTLALQMTLCWGRGWLKCLADRTPVKKKKKKHIHPLASELGQMRHFETESCPKGSASSCGFLSVARRLQLLKPFWEVLISLGFSVPFTYESTIKEY